MYKYHCLNPIAAVGLNQFTEKYEAQAEMKNVDAVLVRSAAMHELEFDEDLKVIARAGAGVNNIPLQKCAEEGIVVFNTPGANANGVKELVIAGMLLASRDIVGGISWVKENEAAEDIAKQAEKAKKAFAGCELEGKKLGVIGLGAIGVLVANAAEKLGMEVYGYDPYLSVDGAWNLSRNVKHVTSLDDIYANCDYISIHVPLNDSTRHTVNEETIAKMKDGVRILNYARGELVDSDAIIKALEEGKVASYVVDFPDDKVLGVEGVIAIPHLGASTPESEENCAYMAAKEIVAYLEKGSIINSVNMPNVKLGAINGARVCVIHKNVPNTIAQISSCFSNAGLNIDQLSNNSRGDYAYTVVDIADVTDDAVKEIEEIEQVISVRVIK
ncbi:MAG: 3-phosphoglycerate dehydrogenase [Clostridia bacterium]|nr:3-phosphoglycerate dehydrogenase [Clostridia bacterium]